MPELRKDPITGRWVIISIERASRPKDFKISHTDKKEGPCPFCPGSEKMTPPELEAVRGLNTKPDTPGWSVRVIPNKFPAFEMKGNLDKRNIGLYDVCDGVGAHEVIIETPDHNKDLADLTKSEIKDVIFKYRARSIDLAKDARVKYILIFKNHGESAGASLEHTHSQLITLPIIPKRVNEELKGASDYFSEKKKCVFCDMILQESKDKLRIISQNEDFIAFCPFASRFAFETWIMPKNHNHDFKSIDDKKIVGLASILKDSLIKLKKVLNDPAYNFIIHTAPVKNGVSEGYHWHIEIMPKLTNVAGFEWGSGFYINPTSPEIAAKHLREVKL